MYLRILKKDLQRKKTMNVILLIFIILAATFIASSANNMATVMTALDNYFDKAMVPDYWVVTLEAGERDRLQDFVNEQGYEARQEEMISVDPADIKVDGVKLEYSNSACITTAGKTTKIFDQNNQEITKVAEGEVYLTGDMFYASGNDFKIGSNIEITVNGKTKSLTLAGSMKDAMYGSSMIGMTRFLVSEEDYGFLQTDYDSSFYSMCIYTEDREFMDKFNAISLRTVFALEKGSMKIMYIMDMLMAGVMLIVSVCLILISMLILRFTIQFTMSEEFREIGVMKAIGIQNRKIRGLYIIKYLAISVVGSAVGLLFSVPFGNMMLGNLPQNIILQNGRFWWLGMIAAVAVAFVVVLFCYLCTGKIKTFSPIDAIRNGENGERYERKGVVHLSRWKFSPVPFMAVNDILSGMKRYVVMILIFTLGILLVIIPINSINTLQSDKIVNWFSMAECDHVISKELFFNSGEESDNLALVKESLKEVKEKLSEEGIGAKVFREVLFKMNISCQDKRTSSLAFQGVGDVTTDMYAYLRGTAPQNQDEVAVSYLIADRIGADIGDTVEIKNGEVSKKYVVTAIYQTMNNLGEGIRFYQDEQCDYKYAMGNIGTQVIYTDSPNQRELDRRKELLKELFPDANIYTSGEYINYMIGDIAGQLQGLKYLILIVVLSINVFMTVLMVRSFLTKEKGEIAMLKAIGFQNSSLVVWQTMRIGIVLLISILAGELLGTPVSKISVGQIFKIMGAYSIEFEVVPLEIYLVYPAIVLIVTVLAGMVTAFQIWRISAVETASVE